MQEKLIQSLFVLYLSLQSFCNRTKPWYTEGKFPIRNEISEYFPSSPGVKEKNYLGEGNLQAEEHVQNFGPSLIKKKSLEFGKKHFSTAVNLNNIVWVCVRFLHTFPAL